MPPKAERMWSFTIRPTDGVTDRDVERFVKWVSKFPAMIITELVDRQENTRHIHAAVQFDTPRYKLNLQTGLCTLFSHFTDEQKVVLRKGVKLWYNYDLIDNYFTKTSPEEGGVIIREDLADMDFNLFPPPNDESHKRPISVWFRDREIDFLEKHSDKTLWPWYNGKVSEYTILVFINTLMYKDRTIEIICDPKFLKGKVRGLVNYLNKSTSPIYTDGFRPKYEGPPVETVLNL